MNVAALVGHTALRNNHMDRLDRSATRDEVMAMREQLREALAHGAIGLSTGLAYGSAIEADTAEVKLLAEVQMCIRDSSRCCRGAAACRSCSRIPTPA